MLYKIILIVKELRMNHIDEIKKYRTLVEFASTQPPDVKLVDVSYISPFKNAIVGKGIECFIKEAIDLKIIKNNLLKNLEEAVFTASKCGLSLVWTEFHGILKILEPAYNSYTRNIIKAWSYYIEGKDNHNNIWGNFKQEFNVAGGGQNYIILNGKKFKATDFYSTNYKINQIINDIKTLDSKTYTRGKIK
jgi:hypothetical protein